MSGSDTGGGRRVLVVEDEADFLATYERLLGRQGYRVITAMSRAGGLAAVRAATGDHRLDLVICDVRLPDGDGLDVVRAARGVAEPPSVIVITGYSSDETRRAAVAAGAVMFLAKPFAAAALLAAVRSSLPPTSLH
jgi:two-component system response regulator PilR (NtrC family)